MSSESGQKKRKLNADVRLVGEGIRKLNAGEYVRIVDEGLRKLIGGVKLCRKEELTRAVLLEFLKSQGAIKEVKGLVEVTVQTMAGASFGVMLEEGGGSNSSVRALKAEIKETEGTPSHRQDLLMLVEDAEEGSEEPLSDDFEIESPCTVALCVLPEEEWEWDTISDLVRDEVFELSGPNNSIATNIDQDKNYNNCLVTGRAMGTGTGKHTISMKLAQTQGSSDDMNILCGVVRDGAPCNEDHAMRDSTLGWFMESEYGCLCGNYKQYTDRAGEIKSGQVLTMQVDTDAGTLKFWVDGNPHGPGFTDGVTGPLRWATTVCYKGNNVEIVPTPKLC